MPESFSLLSEPPRQKLSPAALRQRMSGIVESLPDAVLCIDRTWHITYANPEAIRIARLRPELFATLDLWRTFPDILGTEMERRFRAAMASGSPDRFEFNHEPLDVRLDIHLLPTDEGFAAVLRDVTTRRHDQIVYRQLELLKTVQAVSRAATWEYDAATGAIEYGPGAFPVFGRALSLTTMAELEAIVTPDALATTRARIANAVASGELLHIEFPVLGPDGSIVWIEMRAQTATQPAMQAHAASVLRGIFIDVTQRRLDQQDLVASEARYRVLADLNPNAIWMGDAQGNVTYANHGFLAYIGLTPADLKGGGWLEAFAPADRPRVLEVWSHSLLTGVDYDIEALIRRKETGEHRFWHLRAAPVRDASGAILHWLGVGQDVHDSRTYTAALRAQQMETERRRAELESIYATTPIGLALLDPVDFTFLNLNEHEAQMLGAPLASLIGRPLAEIAPPEKLPGLMELLHSVANGAVVRNQVLEGELAARPGDKRAWSVNYAPIYNEDGSVRAISTASIEITHQKRAEAALIQSEKLAAVGRLASSISHEINNPLEAITNLLYLISIDDLLPSPLKVYINMAQSELSRVSQIATQTLRFHRQAVAPTHVTASELVEAVVRLYIGRLTNSHIEVDARYDTHTRVLCFENDIRQVLNNLIANAIDAMRTGGRLVVRAHQVSTPRPGLRITIADTGHGMSAAVLAHIFEPFFTTKDLQGTGLGLWISAGIVERHRGRLRARSSEQPGSQGTVFTLFLPLGEEPTLAGS